MKIFLTGAGGFIGRTLLKRLAQEGHITTSLLLEDESADGIASITQIVRGDITQPATLGGLIDDHDAVIHLAGAVGYGQSWERCIAINVDGTRNVANEAVRAGAKRFIHMSSVSVYGRVPEVLLSEDAPLRKTGEPYGDTKIEAEHVLEEVGKDGALNWTILRPTVIYGPGDDKFLPKLIENLRSGSARVIGKGDGSVDLIHVNDVADFIERILLEPRAFEQTLNLADPDTCSWKELMGIVADELNVPPPTKHLPYPLALGIAGGMEIVSILTRRPPRLTRYAIRVVGRQYRYLATRAQELGFNSSVPVEDGIVGAIANSNPT